MGESAAHCGGEYKIRVVADLIGMKMRNLRPQWRIQRGREVEQIKVLRNPAENMAFLMIKATPQGMRWRTTACETDMEIWLF